MIFYLSLGMKFDTGKKVAAALKDLEQGEVAPIIAPKVSRRKGSAASLDRARLRALQHLEFEQGLGTKEKKAVFQIAKELGQTESALRKWRQMLRKTMDNAVFEKHLTAARRAGQLVSALRMPNKRLTLPKDIAPINWASPETSIKLEKLAKKYDANELRTSEKKNSQTQRNILRREHPQDFLVM